MSAATIFHLVAGAALAIPGVWLLRNRKTVLGWTLTGLGTVIAAFGILVPAIHRYLHH